MYLIRNSLDTYKTLFNVIKHRARLEKQYFVCTVRRSEIQNYHLHHTNSLYHIQNIIHVWKVIYKSQI